MEDNKRLISEILYDGCFTQLDSSTKNLIKRIRTCLDALNIVTIEDLFGVNTRTLMDNGHIGYKSLNHLRDCWTAAGYRYVWENNQWVFMDKEPPLSKKDVENSLANVNKRIESLQLEITELEIKRNRLQHLVELFESSEKSLTEKYNEIIGVK